MPSKNETKNRFGLIMIMMVLGTLAISSAFPADPTAESILADYIEATGGQAAYDKIRNRVTEGELVIEGAGISLKGKIIVAKPNLSYTLFESDAIGTIEKGTDGDLVWEKTTMGGPQITEGPMREFTLREGTLDKLVYWKDLYAGAELAGSLEVEGRDCHKVLLRPETGEPVIVYFDKETHLLMRQDFTVETPMGTVPVESTVTDYREVDGILLPFQVKVGNLGQARVITTTSVKHNVDLPVDRFTVPADILALAPTGEEVKE